MLFTLKKLVSVFLMPFSIALILLFIATIFLLFNRYKKAKFFLSIGFLWLFLISYQPFANSLIKPLESKYNSYLEVNPKIEYVLVLGAGHKSNEKRSVMSQMSKTSLARLNEGIRIYKQLENAKLILSGYGGEDIVPHAIMAKKAAISLGINENSILIQEKAKDTVEEAMYAKKTIKDKSFILVTSALHMPRAMEIFATFGLKPIAAPADFLSDISSEYSKLPEDRYLLKTTAAIHEYLGQIWFKISRLFRF